jgi:hypothetical protein
MPEKKVAAALAAGSVTSALAPFGTAQKPGCKIFLPHVS